MRLVGGPASAGGSWASVQFEKRFISQGTGSVELFSVTLKQSVPTRLLKGTAFRPSVISQSNHGFTRACTS